MVFFTFLPAAQHHISPPKKRSARRAGPKGLIILNNVGMDVAEKERSAACGVGVTPRVDRVSVASHPPWFHPHSDFI